MMVKPVWRARAAQPVTAMRVVLAIRPVMRKPDNVLSLGNAPLMRIALASDTARQRRPVHPHVSVMMIAPVLGHVSKVDVQSAIRV